MTVYGKAILVLSIVWWVALITFLWLNRDHVSWLANDIADDVSASSADAYRQLCVVEPHE